MIATEPQKEFMEPTIALVGGFLGAGKTTAMLRAAHQLAAQGCRVGIVTNDQAEELVDTALAQQHGLIVKEVPGGCFCCRFDDFMAAVIGLGEAGPPDIILAEPVGSCTDLSATVYEPIKRHYAHQYRLAPLSIVVDPFRLSGLLLTPQLVALPASVRYLYQQQLAEADILILNKVDLLSSEQMEQCVGLLESLVPGTQILTMSARTGHGVSDWLNRLLAHERRVGQRYLDLDYHTYAEAEASLGWLNARVRVCGQQPFEPTRWVSTFFNELNGHLRAAQAEVGHVKVYLKSPTGFIKASMVTTEGLPSYEQDSMAGTANEGQAIINARVNMLPAQLEQIVRRAIDTANAGSSVNGFVVRLQSFSPPPPKPQYRLGNGVG